MSQGPYRPGPAPPPPPKDDLRARPPNAHQSSGASHVSSIDVEAPALEPDTPAPAGQFRASFSQFWNGKVEHKMVKRKPGQLQKDELLMLLERKNLELLTAEQELREYQQDIEHERSANAELRESAGRMVALFEQRDLGFGQQAPDDEIERQYGMIEVKVKAWSRILSNEVNLQPVRFQDKELSRINRILPNISNTRELSGFLANESRRKLVARAWVHRVLYEEIFNRRRLREDTSAGTNLWMGSRAAVAMESFESIFVKNRTNFSPREINDWRAYSVGLLSRTDIEAEAKSSEWYAEGIQQIIRSIMSLNTTLLAAETLQSKLDPAINGLKEIVELALHFSKCIRQQRALWTVGYPGNPAIHTTSTTEVLQAAKRQEDALLFDPETMEDKKLDETAESDGLQPQQSGKVVSIMIVPALYKRGSADGTQYDKEACFVRAKVWC